MWQTRATKLVFAATALFAVVGAGNERTPLKESQPVANSPAAVVRSTAEGAVSGPSGDEHTRPSLPMEGAASALPSSIDWSSVNSGGTTGASSTNFKMGFSVGQSVAGSGASTSYKTGIGFWYGAAAGGGGACPIALTGDMNLSGTITSADIIGLVNFVFKGGDAPGPCAAAGDVNCTATITSADIIYLVNHVFKGGDPPCDVCALIPASWTCP